MRRINKLKATLSILFGLALLTVLFFMNLRFAKSSPGGNDFLPRWLGTRLYITRHQNPYSAETTLAIQQVVYGRAAQPGEDQALFAYPLYSIILFAPFSLVSDYALARALWITLLEFCLAGAAVVSIGLGEWKPGLGALAAYLFFSVVWFHSAKPLVDGNAAIVVALLFTLALLMLQHRRDSLAGLLFALSTIKPQMVLLVLLFILIWAWLKGRRQVLWAFVVSLGALVAFSFFLQPSWLLQDIAQALLYQSYSPPGTLAGAMSQWWGTGGHQTGLAISLAFGLLLLFEWFNSLYMDFDRFMWTVSITLVLAPLLGWPSTTSNYVIFLPILAWLFGSWERRVEKTGHRLAWLDLTFLLLVPWFLFLMTLQPGSQFREHLIMLFPAPVFLLINLYWLRWWVQYPRGGTRLRARGF